MIRHPNWTMILIPYDYFTCTIIHTYGIFDQQREYSIVRRSKCISNGEYFFLVEMSGIEPAATIWPGLAFQWINKFGPGYKPKKAFPMSKRRSEVCRGVYRISVGGGGAGGGIA